MLFCNYSKDTIQGSTGPCCRQIATLHSSAIATWKPASLRRPRCSTGYRRETQQPSLRPCRKLCVTPYAHILRTEIPERGLSKLPASSWSPTVPRSSSKAASQCCLRPDWARTDVVCVICDCDPSGESLMTIFTFVRRLVVRWG